MSALCTRFDALQSFLDREIDRLIITSFEMEERQVAGAAPIAAIKRSIVKEIECTPQIVAVLLGHDQQDLIAHARAQPAEEFARQIGWIPFLISRGHIAIEKSIPNSFGQVAAGKPFEGNATGGNRRTFFSQI